MALPNKTDLQTLDYSYGGLPFADVESNSSVNTQTMDYSYGGLPYVTNPTGGGPAVVGPVNLKSWCGVVAANIKAINGVPLANVKSITGIF